MSTASDPPAVPPAHSRAIALIASATVLALLYLGREVLVPITLALILSLLVAPPVRWLRRVGLGHAPSVLIAVLVLAMFLVGLGTIIGSQVAHMASSLPQYEETVHAKVQALSKLTAGRLEAVQDQVSRVMNQLGDHAPEQTGAPAETLQNPKASTNVVPVEIRAAPPTAMGVVTRIFSSI